MTMWHKSTDESSLPKDRRLLLITQRSGTSDLLDMDIYDVVVGHWNQFLWGFVIANESNETPSGAKLIVRYWAGLADLTFGRSAESWGMCPARPRSPSPRCATAALLN